jgi:hypothetical protein
LTVLECGSVFMAMFARALPMKLTYVWWELKQTTGH